jgi:hypothetical protein
VGDRPVAMLRVQLAVAAAQHNQVMPERRKFSLTFQDCLHMTARHLNLCKNNMSKLPEFGGKLAKCMSNKAVHGI